MVPVGLATLLIGCQEEAPQIPAAPSGSWDTSSGSGSSSDDRNRSGLAVRRVIVLEGTVSRSADGSEVLTTDLGDSYTLRRMPGCVEVGEPVPKVQTRDDIIYSDCLEFAMARLLVVQAIREKPNADNITLRQWLRMSGGQMTTEFREWPDQDVAKMIEICRRVGGSKFISGDFPRPVRRQPVRKRKPTLHRRYRVRGSFRGRIFEARSIERV